MTRFSGVIFVCSLRRALLVSLSKEFSFSFFNKYLIHSCVIFVLFLNEGPLHLIVLELFTYLYPVRNISKKRALLLLFHCTKNEVFSLRISSVNFRKLRIWSLTEEILNGNFIFCAMFAALYTLAVHDYSQKVYLSWLREDDVWIGNKLDCSRRNQSCWCLFGNFVKDSL